MSSLGFGTQELIVLLVVIFVLGVIAYLIGKRAVAKGRSGWRWGLLSLFPLIGPLGAALLLWTMPPAGHKASLGQMIGRVFVLLLIFALAGRIVPNDIQEIDAEGEVIHPIDCLTPQSTGEDACKPPSPHLQMHK